MKDWRKFQRPKAIPGETNDPKYNNKKVEVDGIIFDSTIEGKHYIMLRDAELKPICQWRFELQPKFRYNGKTILSINYLADFFVTLKYNYVLDTKGFLLPMFKMKAKMVLYHHDEEIICVSSLKKMTSVINMIRAGNTPTEINKVINPPKKKKVK